MANPTPAPPATPKTGWNTPIALPPPSTFYVEGKPVAEMRQEGDAWHAYSIAHPHFFGSARTRIGEPHASEADARHAVEKWIHKQYPLAFPKDAPPDEPVDSVHGHAARSGPPDEPVDSLR